MAKANVPKPTGVPPYVPIPARPGGRRGAYAARGIGSSSVSGSGSASIVVTSP